MKTKKVLKKYPIFPNQATNRGKKKNGCIKGSIIAYQSQPPLHSSKRKKRKKERKKQQLHQPA